MNTFERSTQTIFCDDIRIEASSKKIIIGTYGYRFGVNGFPFTFPKLCAYTQFSYKISDGTPSFKIKIFKNGELLVESPASQELVARTEKQSIAENRPYSSVFGTVEFVNLEISEPCTIFSVIEVDGVDYESARLEIYYNDKPKTEV